MPAPARPPAHRPANRNPDHRRRCCCLASQLAQDDDDHTTTWGERGGAAPRDQNGTRTTQASYEEWSWPLAALAAALAAGEGHGQQMDSSAVLCRRPATDRTRLDSPLVRPDQTRRAGSPAADDIRILVQANRAGGLSGNAHGANVKIAPTADRLASAPAPQSGNNRCRLLRLPRYTG